MTDIATGLKRSIVVLILALLLWLSLQMMHPLYAAELGPGSQIYILIKFNQMATEAERNQTVAQLGGELVRWIAPLHTAQVKLPAVDRRSLDTKIETTTSNNAVISVEIDGVVSGLPIVETVFQNQHHTVGQSTIPSTPVQVDDPGFNDPQRVYTAGLLELTLAWRYTMGNPNVIIAVVDSGVNAAHPDLSDRVVSGYDFVNNDDDPSDDHGHGTHVSGIIAATANNGIGSAGLCPLCSIMPVKVLDSSNVGTWSAVAAGIVYAVDQGANIINLSLGGHSNTQIIQDAVNYAAAQGVLVVAAAGNGRTDTLFYPAALENVVAVGATRNDDTRWSLSNYGEWVELSAPGYAVYSTYHDLNNYYQGYTFMSGTSMAAPHVAGLAGLLLSQQMDRTPADLRSLMAASAVDLGDPGKDIYFGSGRINASRALSLGMPQAKLDALLAGWVWQDENVNGVWEQEEKAGDVAITIYIWTEAGEFITSTSVDGTGEWRIENLKAGVYKVNAKPDERIILTTSQEYTVQLAESQSIVDLNFGANLSDHSGYNYESFMPVVSRQ
jgi:subtilisin family serine protease